MTHARILAFDPGPTETAFAIVEPAPLTGHVALVRTGKLSSAFESLAALVLAAVAEEGVRGCAIEWPGGYVYEHARGAALIATAEIAGMLYALARMSSLPTERLSATQWRAALRVSNAKGASHDAQIKRICQLLVKGLPRQTNNHERDAMGLALVASRSLWRRG